MSCFLFKGQILLLSDVYDCTAVRGGGGGGVFTVSGARLQLPFIHPSVVPIGLSDCAIWSEAKVQTRKLANSLDLAQITAMGELRPAPNAAKTGTAAI